MSSYRISVEWLFRDIINYFEFVDFKKNLKIQLSSVGKQDIVSVSLKNARHSLYGNATTEYFEIEPLQIQHYFTNV